MKVDSLCTCKSEVVRKCVLLVVMYVGICFIEEWFRPVLRLEQQVMVHWGMYPDRWVAHTHTHTHKRYKSSLYYVHICMYILSSYDSCLPSTDVDANVEEAPAQVRPWKVRHIITCTSDTFYFVFDNSPLVGQTLWSWLSFVLFLLYLENTSFYAGRIIIFCLHWPQHRGRSVNVWH